MGSAAQTVLILTPVKNATGFVETYFASLDRLSYPQRLISLGFLESGSDDATYDRIRERTEPLRCRYASAEVWQKQFNFRIPQGMPRWTHSFQIPRRKILVKARNHLLFRGLRDQDWVLWHLVRLDTVGGIVLLVRADVHRDGLIYPCFPHGAASPAVRRPSPLAVDGEIETEGFGIMARDMGYQCWGMSDLEVLRAPV